MFLRLSKSKVYYMISRKQLPHLRLGRNVRIRMSDLQKWINQRIEIDTMEIRCHPSPLIYLVFLPVSLNHLLKQVC